LVYGPLNVYARTQTAVCSEANDLRTAASAVVQKAEDSQILFGGKSAVLSQLRRLATECAQEGWDGNEAAALDPVALHAAEDFVLALPLGIPMPQCAAEPDGAISLDWVHSRNRLISVSVGSSYRLAYAWLDGADKGHAVAGFDGCQIPSRVLSEIESIVNDANTSLRAA
jgi:hypothetical protein